MPNSQPSLIVTLSGDRKSGRRCLEGVSLRMCGIAGYSLSASSRVERTLAAQALLAGIAERGADAVGYAYRHPGRRDRDPQAALRRQRPARPGRAPGERDARCWSTCATTPRVIPRIEANNHPIRHGSVVGVHNGIIFNDDELMARARLRARASLR